VDIWSRFMRDGHQGVPVANLPSAPGGGMFSNLLGGAQPAPPAPVPTPQAAAQRQTTGTASLDGWMLNNLFGRSRN
jgi:penicillin-binding protein 1A